MALKWLDDWRNSDLFDIGSVYSGNQNTKLFPKYITVPFLFSCLFVLVFSCLLSLFKCCLYYSNTDSTYLCMLKAFSASTNKLSIVANRKKKP